MNKRVILFSVISAVAVISLALNGALVYLVVKNSQLYQQDQVNKKVLEFRNMFTERVLLSGREIDFDSRLELETLVRSLNDPEIFSQWQKFTGSQDKEEATIEAKNLLQLLINKTSQ